MKTKKSWAHLEHEEQGEELWLLSYADMMTLLFGFFVILYSLSSTDDKKFDQMSEQMAKAFQAPKEAETTSTLDTGIASDARQIRALHLLVAMMNLGESMDKAVQNIEKSYEERGENAAAKTLVSDRIAKNPDISLKASARGLDEAAFIELNLPESILFSAGSAELKPEARKKIRKLGSDLQLVPGIRAIEVIGHSDSRAPQRSSLFRNNFALSSVRAGSIAEVLMEGGVKAEKIAVKGMGSLKPLYPEYDEAQKPLLGNMEKNRRVQIILRKVAHGGS